MRRRLWVEFVVLFVLLPLLFAAVVHLWRWQIGVFAALWIFGAACLVVLMLDRTFDRRSLIRLPKGYLRLVLVRFAGAALALGAVLVAVQSDLLLAFPRRNPVRWVQVMALYPVLSVLPQTIIYRVFVFHRYRRLARGLGMVGLSAAAFALCHVVFLNWVALVLTAAGGVLFAWTYWRTRSGLLAWFEHALYGCYIITLGLGVFVYLPPVRT